MGRESGNKRGERKGINRDGGNKQREWGINGEREQE